MQTTAEQFQHWLIEAEGVRLEFKEAKQSYPFDKLVKLVGWGELANPNMTA